ncbi:penicillin-binding protein 2 [Bacillus sp. Marseille-Q3570]|uniref:peptidoglycan D,D-transpeptidase FtsI family protein n=1 Tax=Bacillus sp. Marseille-Q3570 TaxID=2963522 RepID=UPI0021B74C14|nr:penicillin-binding protein 2 [Bacillus sp. Marseille-Q3570]
MDNENKKKKKKFLPARLNLLFMVVFILFTILIIRLGFVQIVNGEYFKTQSEMTTNIEASVQTERGKMFDRHGELVVTNIPSFALTYIRIQGTSSEEHLEYAEKIASLVHMPTKKITKRDWQDYWVLKQGKTPAGAFKAYEMKLTEEELNSKEIEDSEKYRLVLDRITEEDLKPLKEDEEHEQILAVKRELDRATNLDVTFVKTDLTEKEMAVIGEHLGELEGRFGISSTATRAYPKGNEFFFGSIKSIPADRVDHYLLKGYARNNLVGTSYLETQYEGLLKGQDKTYTFTTTKDGKPIGAPEISTGTRGHDLVLSVDMNLQNKIGKILEEKISLARGRGDGPVNSAYVVMMDPNSGEVLAMVGREYENGKFTDDSYATLQKAFEMGSTVKGATVLAMHQMGGAPVINDQPIALRGGPKGNEFSSYGGNRIGVVNDKQALEQSSNVYMGIGIGQYAGLRFPYSGSTYSLSGSANTAKFKETFNKLKGVYSSVGLGVKTGIDLPEEALGYEGGIPINPGMILYYTIGQYDTYTPIQMAQYASTVANGGYRVQPHLLKEVRYSTGTDELGPLVSEFDTKVINRIDNTKEEINRVKEGFYMVTHGSRGTARELNDTMIAGKTGTAQRQQGPGAYNLTFIGYAPYDNPEVAFSVVVPNLNSGHVNVEIVDEIVKAYNEGYTPEDTEAEDDEATDAESEETSEE